MHGHNHGTTMLQLHWALFWSHTAGDGSWHTRTYTQAWRADSRVFVKVHKVKEDHVDSLG